MSERKKTVLMICYYFPPCSYVGALRSGKYVKYLGRFGWKSEVLTAYKSNKDVFADTENVSIHTARNIDVSDVLNVMVTVWYFCISILKRLTGILRRKEKIGGQKDSATAKVKGGLGIADKICKWMLLPDPQFLWILLALPKALWLSRKCDVIYTTVWPLSPHVLGLIVKKITRKRWIADYRDPWTLNLNWFPPTRFHRWLGVKLDEACVKNADVVVNVTKSITESFRQHFKVCTEKFITIPNGYDEEDLTKFIDVKPDENVFVMTSIGSLYGGRDAGPFLRAIQKLVESGFADSQNLVINLIGGQNPTLQRQVDQMGIAEMVKVMPFMSQQDAFMELAKSQVAVLIGSEMEKTAMTTKLYEYAGMGKPILALVPEGTVHDFVVKCGGRCANYKDVEEISKAITNIFEQYKCGKYNSGNKCNFVEKYERRELTRQLAECFDGFVETRYE
jgi:glycosyltransferase involved in cell wall biosynthesis